MLTHMASPGHIELTPWGLNKILWLVCNVMYFILSSLKCAYKTRSVSDHYRCINLIEHYRCTCCAPGHQVQTVMIKTRLVMKTISRLARHFLCTSGRHNMLQLIIVFKPAVYLKDQYLYPIHSMLTLWIYPWTSSLILPMLACAAYMLRWKHMKADFKCKLCSAHAIRSSLSPSCGMWGFTR